MEMLVNKNNSEENITELKRECPSLIGVGVCQRYNSGNYFMAESEAEQKLEKIKEILKGE